MLFQDVSFQVRAGEILIVRGSNGSGKSTLLRCLAGLQPRVAGEVELDRNDIAYLGHKPALHLGLSVKANLWFAMRLRHEKAESMTLIESSLTSLKSREFMHSRVGDLSAGQRRRVALAQMLCMKASTWLLDEPQTSLDSGAETLLTELMQKHVEQNGSIVLSSHVPLDLRGSHELVLDDYAA